MDPLSSTPQIHFGRVPLKELSPFATARNRFNRFTSPSTSSIGDSVKITGPKPFLSDRESVGSASPSPNKLKRKRSSSSVKEGSDQTGMLSRIIKKTKTSKPKKEALEGRISLIKRQQANDKKGLDYNLSQPAGTRVWDNAGGRHLYTGTKEYENFVNHQYKEVFRSQNAEIAQKKEKLEKFDNGFLNRINPFSSQRSLDDSSINNRGRSRNRTEDTSRRSRSAPIDTTYSPTRTLGHYSDSTYSSSNETLSDMGEQRYRRGRSPFSDSAYSSSSESLSGNRSQRSRSSSIDSSSSNPSFPSSAQNLSNQNYAFWKAPLLWTESELQSAGARKIPRVLGYSGREGSTILPAFNSKKDALKLRLSLIHI